MSSIRSKIVSSLIVKRLMKPQFDLGRYSVNEIRQKGKPISARIKIPFETTIEKVNIEGLPAEWIKAKNVSPDDQKCVLYFHSGGFCLEYSNTHRELAARISHACGIRVLAIDYALAPENQYPAANDDCLKAYQWLLEKGIQPRNIVIGGDSAGGGLTMMTLLSLRDMGIPYPAAVFMLSPMGIDLDRFDGESYVTKAGRDPLNTKDCIMKFAECYLGNTDVKPQISFEEDLHGFPSIFIQLGSNEVILSDSVRLARQAEKAGVDVTLEIWENMWHVFQGFASIVPEARQAIINIGDFIKKKLN